MSADCCACGAGGVEPPLFPGGQRPTCSVECMELLVAELTLVGYVENARPTPTISVMSRGRPGPYHPLGIITVYVRHST